MIWRASAWGSSVIRLRNKGRCVRGWHLAWDPAVHDADGESDRTYQTHTPPATDKEDGGGEENAALTWTW